MFRSPLDHPHGVLNETPTYRPTYLSLSMFLSVCLHNTDDFIFYMCLFDV